MDDVTEAHQNLVLGALNDIEDMERDAGGWPDAEEIQGKAAEAVQALEALSEVMSTWMKDHPPESEGSAP